MADPLIGRNEELNAVQAFLSAPRDGPSIIVLEGEAGVGKTSKCRLARSAAGVGRQVLRARPTEDEMALSFAALSDLLGGVLDTALAGLPAPQRHALEVALLLEPEGERAPEGKRSVTLRLEYRADGRTLRDEEVEAQHARVVRALEAQFGAQK